MTSPSASPDDHALIAASQQGDPSALDALVRRHQDRVYGFAMRMCRNVEDAKDILQETFLGMFRSIRDFRAESKFTTWLYRIASNVCLKKRRRGVHDPTPEQELSLDDLMPRPDGEGRKPEIADWSEDAERALCGANWAPGWRQPSTSYPGSTRSSWSCVMWRGCQPRRPPNPWGSPSPR